MADYSISGMSWLQPQRTPGQALASGVQMGSLLAASMQRQQELAMQQAEFPLRMQALDLQGRLAAARLSNEALETKERASRIDDWMSDREKLSDWMALPDTEVMTATPPSVRSDVGMNLIAKRRKMASENSVVAARQGFEASNNKAAEYLLQRGVDVPQRTRPDGTPYYEQADIAAAGLKLDEREQAQLLDIWKQKGETAITVADIRADTALAIAEMKNATEIEKFLNNPMGAHLSVKDRALLRGYASDLKDLENRVDLQKPENAAELKRLKLRLRQEYGIPPGASLSMDAPTPAGPPAGAPAPPVKRWVNGKWQ